MNMTAVRAILYSVLIATAAAAQTADASTKVYPAKGIVLAVDPQHRALTVSCDAIPGFMAAMKMPFTARDAKELAGISPGASIGFDLVVNRTSSYIRNIRVLKFENLEQDPLGAQRLKVVAGAAAGAPLKELKPGEKIQDFTLTDQNRREVSLSQFRGKVVGITFIYTGCALPDYCYRMSTNFGRIQRRFVDQMGKDLILLTITFDPVHDTPEVMNKYGKTWNADARWWHMLTGSKADVEKVCRMFGISFWPDEGLMTHSLHTFVVDRHGILAADLEGNKFSADQLGDLVASVMARKG
jgi:protein SCO1/2